MKRLLRLTSAEDIVGESYGDDLMPFIVRFGWDSGGPESGPSYGYGEALIYALSKEDACARWESENVDQIQGLNDSGSIYEGCFAWPASDDEVARFEDENAYQDELVKHSRFEDGNVYPID